MLKKAISIIKTAYREVIDPPDYSVPDYKPETHKDCPECEGTGHEDIFSDCETCKGTGIVRKTYQEYTESLPPIESK